jgi:hypothetical protein
MVQRARQVGDLVLMESSTARAVKEMKAYDPEFDLINLNYEAEEIFKEFYCNFLSGNQEYLEKVCGGPALAICKSEVKRRITEGWRYKFDDILDYGHTNFSGAQVPEKQPPQFTFTI